MGWLSGLLSFFGFGGTKPANPAEALGQLNQALSEAAATAAKLAEAKRNAEAVGQAYKDLLK